MKVALFVALLGLSACSSSASDADAGAGTDAGADAGTDAGADAGTDAGADAGTDAGTDAGVAERVIFVTRASWAADLGGIGGADALCAAEASEAGLVGEFKAWLSTIDSAVAGRMTQSSAPYVRTDGVRVADDWDDLTDGMLLSRINRDAAGVEQAADVWTGTLPSGLSYTETDCDGFTNGETGLALCGTTQSINANWTANQVPACDTRLRLFCVEQ